jgi:hypothetical protein
MRQDPKDVDEADAAEDDVDQEDRSPSSPAMLALMMKPATIGPRIAETPITGPNRLTAVGICSRENMVVRIPIPWGDEHRAEPTLENAGGNEHRGIGRQTTDE